MRNGFLLVAGLVVVWQALFQFAGAHALSPPLETALYLAHLLGTAQFWGHLLETGRAFAAALLLSVVLGLGIGLPFGLNKMAAEIAERKSALWLEQNREAIDAWNDVVERTPLPLARFRQF